MQKLIKLWNSLFIEGVFLKTFDNEVFYTSNYIRGGSIYTKSDFKILVWTHKPFIIIHSPKTGAIVVDKSNWEFAYEAYKFSWLNI